MNQLQEKIKKEELFRIKSFDIRSGSFISGENILKTFFKLPLNQYEFYIITLKDLDNTTTVPCDFFARRELPVTEEYIKFNDVSFDLSCLYIIVSKTIRIKN
jgi:hypothetical protein